MRILMLSYEFPPIGGGGAGVVHGLSAQLVELGHEVDVVTMQYRGLPREERVDGVHVYRAPCIRLSPSHCTMAEQATYVAAALPLAARLARTRSYDINHTHFIFPDGLIALRLLRSTGLPYIITSHGSDVPGYNPHRFRRAHRLLAPVWRRVVDNATRIVCPSDTLQQLVSRANPEATTTIIPNGIEVGAPPRMAAKEARILVVTRMLERKGVQYFLQALQGSALGHDIQIVGDGPYLGALRQLADALGVDVTFRGWLDRSSDELSSLYATSRIHVFTSEAENFPLVLLEAMAAGAAIITTKDTGCEEVVGDAALLVPPRDPAAIRDALERLTADPELCARLGAAARRRLETNFSWSRVARQYIECYGVPAPAMQLTPHVGALTSA